MKFLKKMPLTILLIVTGIVFTIVAFLNRSGSYMDYDQNVLKHPMFTILFQGLHEGVKPGDEARSVAAAREAEELARQQEERRAAEEAAAAARAEEERKAQPVTEFPAGVNSEVVQALSYGIENRAYMAPEGTTWPLQQEGIFKPIVDEFFYLQPVDDSYFADALFIGDSRTYGLAGYSSLNGSSNFLAADGLSIYKLFDTSLSYWQTGSTEASTATVSEVLGSKTFSKIYLCVGINELGTGTTVDFFAAYKQALEQLRTLQPDAILYIQGIMHVSHDMSSTDPVFSNTNIVEKNTAIASLANGRDIFYIDMNSSVCDENGEVLAELTGDGIHLKASAYERWHQFLKDNAIVRTE